MIGGPLLPSPRPDPFCENDLETAEQLQSLGTKSKRLVLEQTGPLHKATLSVTDLRFVLWSCTRGIRSV